MKWGLLIGVPSLATFLASAYTQIMENIVFFFLLSVAALIVAILPLIYEQPRR
jgi:hypothetical protein